MKQAAQSEKDRERRCLALQGSLRLRRNEQWNDNGLKVYLVTINPTLGSEIQKLAVSAGMYAPAAGRGVLSVDQSHSKISVCHRTTRPLTRMELP